MRLAYNSFLFLILLFCVSCVSIEKGPDKEVKSPLGYLNGETYGAPQEIPNGTRIPVAFVAKVHNKNTILQGFVFYKQGEMAFPLGNQKLRLKNNKDELIQEVQSSGAGEFEFSKQIPNGKYRIELFAKEYKGSIGVEISSYEIKGLKLQAFEKILDKQIPF